MNRSCSGKHVGKKMLSFLGGNVLVKEGTSQPFDLARREHGSDSARASRRRGRRLNSVRDLPWKRLPSGSTGCARAWL